jgi:hypothetical protein
LNEEYQLPELSALPSSYYGCVNALQGIDPKIETHKPKLDAPKSFQKEGSILASTALNRSKKKRRDAAEAELKKAQKAILTTENKAK